MLAAVGEWTGILLQVLVVISRPQQASNPGGVAVVASDFLIRDLTVAVGIKDDVGVCGCIVTDGNSNHLVGIGLDRLEQHSAQTIHKKCCASSKTGTRTAVLE